MNIGLTIKEVMTVKQGMIVTLCCNEYLPCAIMTKETMNVGMTGKEWLLRKEEWLKEWTRKEGMARNDC